MQINLYLFSTNLIFIYIKIKDYLFVSLIICIFASEKIPKTGLSDEYVYKDIYI